jgi:hypothetical protein
MVPVNAGLTLSADWAAAVVRVQQIPTVSRDARRHGFETT